MIKKQSRQDNRKTYIVISIILAIALLIAWQIWTPVNKWLAVKKIPPVPNLMEYPSFLSDYINKLHQQALENPLSGNIVGKLAKAFHANSFYNEAIQTYTVAGKLDPLEWHWPYYRALIANQVGDTRETVNNLLVAVSINPNVANSWFHLGNAYLKKNAFPEATSAFSKILYIKSPYKPKIKGIEFSNKGAFPIKAYASYNLARIAFLQKEYESSKEMLLDIIQTHPQFGSAYRLLGQVYDATEEKEKSIIYKELAGDFAIYIPPADIVFDELVLSSRQSEFILKQFDIALSSENIKWAIFLLGHIVKYNPDDDEALIKHLRLGIYLQKFDTIEPVIHRFLDTHKSDEIQLQKMADFIIGSGHYVYALEIVKQAIRLNPASFKSHVSYLKIMNYLGRYKEAIQHARKVLSKYNNVDVRVALATSLRLIGNVNEANQQALMSLKINPQHPGALYENGMIEKNQGNSRKAIEYFRKSIKKDPLNIVTQMDLVNYLLELEKHDEALDYINSSLEISPSNIEFLERKAWIYAACPQAKYRNGNEAFNLAKRLDIRIKKDSKQAVRCGIVLAASYAELGQYDQGIKVALQYYNMAEKDRLKYYTLKLEKMINKYKVGKPYYNKI